MALSLLRDWEVVHKALVFAEMTSVKQIKRRLTEHYSSSEAFDQDVLDELELRMSFIKKNSVPLSDKAAWRVVQSQFRALRHGPQLRTMMKGIADAATRPPSKVCSSQPGVLTLLWCCFLFVCECVQLP